MPFLLIMPSYNQAHYIKSAIDSILAQDDADWELWIVDNSTDNTPQVASSYSDPRIKFFHIPERMDPGTCLNWALERAEGRDFSYVHTDNLLGPRYVSEMRKALAGDALSLAYCDMRVIDDDGKYVGIFRRGTFDLARLFSLSPLGVPFAATVALAKKLGGFSTADVADDVLFCLRAYEAAQWVHLPEPLMDYRLHKGSRTTEHGGTAKMEAAFVRSYARALPDMEARGVNPIGALEEGLRRCTLDMDVIAEDLWYRIGEKTKMDLVRAPSFNDLWSMGWFRLPEFKVHPLKTLKARPAPLLKGGRLDLSGAYRFRKKMRSLSGAVHADAVKYRSMVIPWAALKTGNLGEKQVRCWLTSADVFTLWTGHLLEKNCGWKIHILPENKSEYPFWLSFQAKPLPDMPTAEDLTLNLSKRDPQRGARNNMRHLSLYSESR